MNFLKKCPGLFLIIVIGLLWTACEEQPTENKLITPDEPGQWYGYPTWSPTGEWIAYNYAGPEGPSVWGIWFIRPDGSEKQYVTEGFTCDFSPDGKMIVLQSSSEQIFVYDLETKVRTQLTFASSNFFPRWSPDGKKIAYDSNFQDPRGGNVIWIMDSDGRNKKDISQHGVGEWREPDWLPDFRILHIRYGQCRNGPCLFIMDTTGTLLQQLTESGTSNHNAKVSPDGRRIVWQRWDVKTQDIAVWMMNEDGNGKVRLTAGWEPDWAPDGRHIIYRKKGDFIPGKPWDDDDPKVHGSLWIMDVETREQWQFLPPQ